MMVMAPLTDRISPRIFPGVRDSLNRSAENTLMKIGLVAMIKDARLALIKFNPVKKNKL